MNYKKNRLTSLIKKLHDRKILSNPVVKTLVERAIATGDSDPLYKHLENFPVIEAIGERNERITEYQKLDNPLPYPDSDDVQEYLSGQLKLGYINLHNDIFSLGFNILCLPMILPGRVGSGKSYLIKYMAIQIFRRPRSFNVIIPDLKGKEYRNLLPYSKNLKVLTKDKIKLNPLQAPDWMTPMENIMFFSKVFTKENFLMSTSEGILIKILVNIYRKRGVFDGSGNWPTFRDLYNVISYILDKEKSFRFRDVVLLLQNRLDPYIYSENFNCQIGIPDDIWRKENVILEMSKNFTDNMYSFIVSHIAGLRYSYNMEKGLIGSKLRTLFVIDEGRILFRSRDHTVFGESYINEVSTKLREPGIGLILSSQETASFNQTIRSISYTKICFPLTDGNDKDMVRESFGLNDDQANYLFKLPRHGQAIVRYGGYENPFILAVPFLKLKKYVTDEEVENLMAGFYGELQAKMKPAKTPLNVQPDKTMPPNAVTLLFFLNKEPFTKISEMTKAPSFKSPAEVNRALNWLEENGFIKKESYQTSKRGRKSVFAVFTAKAYSYLGAKGLEGKGDFEHKLYQHLVCNKHLIQGLEAKIEGRMKESQKCVDVLVYEKERGFMAFEITLHFDNLASNLQKNFFCGISEVHIVTRDNKADMEKAKKMVEKDVSLNQFRNRIIFRSISDFFS